MNNEMPVNNLFEPGGKGLRWGQEEVDREPQSPLLCRSVFPQPPQLPFFTSPSPHFTLAGEGAGGEAGRKRGFKKESLS